MNQLALAAGGAKPLFGIGMPTPMNDNKEKIDKAIKDGPNPFNIPVGPPGLVDGISENFWLLVKLGYIL